MPIPGSKQPLLVLIAPDCLYTKFKKRFKRFVSFPAAGTTVVRFTHQVLELFLLWGDLWVSKYLIVFFFDESRSRCSQSCNLLLAEVSSLTRLLVRALKEQLGAWSVS